ncbi:hypothetical protein [Eubacterium aggregans]|uniref:hypothetical protein n=1 Tax=Eubacterium aggregans TaxID=81409 RepID=UPI003F35F2A1
MVGSYRNDIDLAFFGVNFGYTKADYETLTPRERAFIYKAFEDKTVQESTLTRNAVMNAVANVNRKKGYRFIDLWKKRSQPVDRTEMQEAIQSVEAMEADKDWVRLIYEANGMHYRGKEVENG